MTLGARMPLVNGEVSGEDKGADPRDVTSYTFFVGGDKATGRLDPEHEGILNNLKTCEMLSTMQRFGGE